MSTRDDEGRAGMRGLFAMTTQTEEKQNGSLTVNCPECGRFAFIVHGRLEGSVEMICTHHQCRAMFDTKIQNGVQTVAILRKAKIRNVV